MLASEGVAKLFSLVPPEHLAPIMAAFGSDNASHDQRVDAVAAVLRAAGQSWRDEVGEWIASDYPLTRRVEDRLAEELALPAGAILLDYPAKTQMLGLELPMQRRDGRVEQLTAAGWEGAINLPRLSDELYRSARQLRVFVADRGAVDAERVLPVLRMPADEVRDRVSRRVSLLG